MLLFIYRSFMKRESLLLPLLWERALTSRHSSTHSLKIPWKYVSLTPGTPSLIAYTASSVKNSYNTKCPFTRGVSELILWGGFFFFQITYTLKMHKFCEIISGFVTYSPIDFKCWHNCASIMCLQQHINLYSSMQLNIE